MAEQSTYEQGLELSRQELERRLYEHKMMMYQREMNHINHDSNLTAEERRARSMSVFWQIQALKRARERDK